MRPHATRTAILAALSLLFLTTAATRNAPTTTPRTPGQRASGKTALQSLVAAEKAFSALSVSQGVKAAFLANLAEDGVIFRPLAINGRTSWQERQSPKGTLVWEPTYAEVAASGDLGVTTGPWEYRSPADAAKPDTAYGDFMTVWRREKGGDWKFVADMGGSHDKPQRGLGQVDFVEGPAHAASSAAGADRPRGADALVLDHRLSAALAGTGAPDAVPQWYADDVRYLHEGDMPRTGAAAVEALTAATAHSRWIPSGGGMARSGDLAFSYGVRLDSSATAGQAPDSSTYRHVWRRVDASWQIATATENPVHPKQ